MKRLDKLLGFCRAACVLAAIGVAQTASAQTTPPTAPLPPPTVPSAPAAPQVIPGPDATRPSGDASAAATVAVAAKPVAVLRGSATWDSGFATLGEAFGKINAELAKANVAATGKPLSVFVETDDNGFRYEAMVPIAQAPAGKQALGNGVEFSQSPAGKAIKFQHRGAYDDIDSTYEAITAWLDEKGLEATNIFVEEYLNDVKTSDDTSLEVDIYVFVK